MKTGSCSSLGSARFASFVCLAALVSTSGLTMRGFANATSLRATALTEEGRPFGEAVQAVSSPAGWILKLRASATTWWRL